MDECRRLFELWRRTRAGRSTLRQAFAAGYQSAGERNVRFCIQETRLDAHLEIVDFGFCADGCCRRYRCRLCGMIFQQARPEVEVPRVDLPTPRTVAPAPLPLPSPQLVPPRTRTGIAAFVVQGWRKRMSLPPAAQVLPRPGARAS